jgi:hypothetical protein
MRSPSMDEQRTNTPSRLGPGGWAVILVLLGFLLGVSAYAIYGWNKLGVVGIPAMGWVFLGGGVVFTVVVGGGLMALMFYSSRKGRDF